MFFEINVPALTVLTVFLKPSAEVVIPIVPVNEKTDKHE